MNVTYLTITLLLIVTTTNLIQAQPVNDACDDAIAVDPASNATILGNTTDAGITRFFDTSFRGLFYEIAKNETITNITSGIVCSDTNDYYPEVFVLKGDDCGDVEVVDDFIEFDECLAFEFPEEVDETYRLFVTLINFDDFESVEGNFEMTLFSELRYTPPNDECEEAVVVDPIVGGTFTGNTSDSVTGGVFYTFDVGSNRALDVTIEVCQGSATTALTILDVFKGDDCFTAEFVTELFTEETCDSISFVAEKNSKFFIVFGIFDENDNGDTYEMTISSEVAKCGFLGLKLFCPRSNPCGFFRRLFNFGNC